MPVRDGLGVHSLLGYWAISSPLNMDAECHHVGLYPKNMWLDVIATIT